MTYIDDNFGHWNEERMEDPDAIAFYHQVQRESVWKRCQGCGCLKKLRPQYGICDSCATLVEQGVDIDPPEIPDEEVDLELQLRQAQQKVEDTILRREEIEYYEEQGDEPWGE